MSIIKKVLPLIFLAATACAGDDHQPLVNNSGAPPSSQGDRDKDTDIPSDDSGQTPPDNNASTILTYTQDILPLIKMRCSLCHNENSGLPNWENYDTLFAKKDRARERVFEIQDMPMNNATSMTNEERDLFATWVDQGAIL